MALRFFISLVSMLALLASCRQVDVYEKVISIPDHAWMRSHKAIVNLDVKDSAYYNILFVIRHTEKFQFTHVITTLTVKDTVKHTKPLSVMRLNIPLVHKNGNWLGDNMDDLYYLRVKINQPLIFKPGRYQFILQHQMKEISLPHVLNVGAAIEKTTAPHE